MKKQQQFLHFVSVLVAAFGVLVFFLLGGGEVVTDQSSLSAGTSTFSDGLNLKVPEADAEELSASRLEAVLREAEAEDDEERTQKLQYASSFQWMVASDKEHAHPACPTQSDSTVKCSDSSMAHKVPPPAPVSPLHDKQQFIAATRKQLAQKYGVALADEAEVPEEELLQSFNNLNDQPESAATVVTAVAPGFYGITSQQPPVTAIRAVVHGEHRNLERGAIVKLRLLDAIEINQTIIPANTFLYGKLSFASCRALIHIQNVQYQQMVYPFKGTIYDKDGFEGLYVPDNRIDEAARKAGSQALGNMNLRIPGASFLSSATNAAVGAVQSVAQQAVKEQKINISSNYLVTIKQSVK